MTDTSLDLFRTVDTPKLADAIELLNVCPRSEGFPSLKLRCLFPEVGVMCGYAVMAHVETVTHANPKDESAFIELFEAIERSRKPGDWRRSRPRCSLRRSRQSSARSVILA